MACMKKPFRMNTFDKENGCTILPGMTSNSEEDFVAFDASDVDCIDFSTTGEAERVEMGYDGVTGFGRNSWLRGG